MSDLTLPGVLYVYDLEHTFWRSVNGHMRAILDSRSARTTREVPVPDDGAILEPDTVYVALSVEHADATPAIAVPHPVAAGLGIHVDAAHVPGESWLLALTVTHAVRVYPGLPVARAMSPGVACG